MAEVFGVGDIPDSGEIPPWAKVSINLRDKKAFPHIDDDFRELMLGLKKDLHNCYLQQQIMAIRKRMPVAVTEVPYFKHIVEPRLKAFNLADWSVWVPTLNMGFYFEELELEPQIEKYFTEYPMSSRTVTVPGALARLKGRLETDSATFTAQYNTPSSYQMTAQDCVTHTDITEDLMQDMVPNAGGFERLRKEVALGVMRSKEDAIINGDDSTISVQGDNHMDSDVAGGAATLFNKAFKGLRKRALAGGTHTYDNGGAAVGLGTFAGLIAAMGKFAKEKGDLFWVLPPTIANRLLTGNVPEVLTHEKFANNATITSGVLPKIFGIEPYESEWAREDLNTSGVYASSNAYAAPLLVKRSRFCVGARAPMRTWVTPSLASSDKLLMSAKERFTFGGVPQSTAEHSVVAAIGVSLN